MFGNLAFFWRLEKRIDSLARIIAHRCATENNYPPNNKNWRDVFWDDYVVPLGIPTEVDRYTIEEYLLPAVNKRCRIYLDLK